MTVASSDPYITAGPAIHQRQTTTLRIDVTMMDTYLLLTPLFALGAFALVRFIGCNWVFGIDETVEAIDPPANVVATPGDQSVALTWFYPMGKAVSFEVAYGTQQGGPYPTKRSVVPAAAGVQHGVTIDSLVNGTTYFFRVGGVGHNSVIQQSAEVSATPGVTEFINATMITLGPVRNDFAGFVGMAIRPTAAIAVTQLGRIVGLGNNTGTHVVKIVQAVNNPVPDGPGSGQDLGAVMIAPPNAGAGMFVYAPLSTPVPLVAGQLYYIVSHEDNLGDRWHDRMLVPATATSGVAAIEHAVFSVDGTAVYEKGTSGAGEVFVPVNFRY